MALTKRELENLADNIELAANENADLSVRENHPKSSFTDPTGYVWARLHKDWLAYKHLTAEGTIASLEGPMDNREAKEARSEYGISRPLSSGEGQKLRKMVGMKVSRDPQRRRVIARTSRDPKTATKIRKPRYRVTAYTKAGFQVIRFFDELNDAVAFAKRHSDSRVMSPTVFDMKRKFAIRWSKTHYDEPRARTSRDPETDLKRMSLSALRRIMDQADKRGDDKLFLLTVREMERRTRKYDR